MSDWALRVELLHQEDDERSCVAALHVVFDSHEDRARAMYEAMAALAGWRASPPVAGASSGDAAKGETI